MELDALDRKAAELVSRSPSATTRALARSRLRTAIRADALSCASRTLLVALSIACRVDLCCAILSFAASNFIASIDRPWSVQAAPNPIDPASAADTAAAINVMFKAASPGALESCAHQNACAGCRTLGSYMMLAYVTPSQCSLAFAERGCCSCASP